MSDQEQISQLSALFDGELPQEQAGMVIRRALKDPAMRAAWGRYALIGACLRDEPLQAAIPGHDLAERVRARLAGEVEHSAAEAPATVTLSGSSRRSALLGRGALGGAIAAGVAVVSVFIVRSMGPAIPAQGPAVAVAQPTPAVQAPLVAQADSARTAAVAVPEDSLPPSYTTPVDNSPASVIPGMANYVSMHSDVAASAVRFSQMSSMMNGGYDPTQGAVEMSAAEVGARR